MIRDVVIDSELRARPPCVHCLLGCNTTVAEMKYPSCVPSVQALCQREQLEQHTEAWFAARGHMLTASDCASVLGQNPYKSRRKVLLSKLGYKDHMGFMGRLMTSHGNRTEDEAADVYEKRLGVKTLWFGLFQHPQHAWLGASPDRVTTAGTVVEIKCPVARRIEPGVVPRYYLPQARTRQPPNSPPSLLRMACRFVQPK